MRCNGSSTRALLFCSCIAQTCLYAFWRPCFFLFSVRKPLTPFRHARRTSVSQMRCRPDQKAVFSVFGWVVGCPPFFFFVMRESEIPSIRCCFPLGNGAQKLLLIRRGAIESACHCESFALAINSTNSTVVDACGLRPQSLETLLLLLHCLSDRWKNRTMFAILALAHEMLPARAGARECNICRGTLLSGLWSAD